MKNTLLEIGDIGPCPLDQLTDGDRVVLTELAKGMNKVVDIGTFLGGSAEAICKGMVKSKGEKHLLTVDSYIFNEDQYTTTILKQIHDANDGHIDWCQAYLRSRLSPFGKRGDFAIYHSLNDSAETAQIMPDGSLDLVFIDGGHTYDQVIKDIRAWVPKIKERGIVAGHDYDRDYDEVLQKSTDYIMQHKKLEFDRNSNLHCGVMAAVLDSFKRFTLPRGKTSIWVARVEDYCG